MAYGKNRSISPIGHLCLLIAAIVFNGCSSSSGLPPVYPVSGKVTMKGQPVEGATIIFVPSTSDGEAATAITNASGEYKLTTYSTGDGARPGKYSVKLSKWDQKLAAKPTGQEKRFITYEEEQATYKEPPPNAPPPPAPKNLLPKKYDSESESGLIHTVAEAPSTFDITID